MFPAIFMTIIIWGYGIYKYTVLYAENQELIKENQRLDDELFALKFTPREIK